MEKEIKVKAKFMLMPRKEGTLIVGGIFSDKLLSTRTNKQLDGDEMWVAELIIKPAYKFAINKEEGWCGLTLDQKIASGWGNKENWKKELLKPNKNEN